MVIKFFFGSILLAFFLGCAGPRLMRSEELHSQMRITRVHFDSLQMEVGSVNTCGNVFAIGDSKFVCDTSFEIQTLPQISCQYQSSKVVAVIAHGWRLFCIDAAGCGQNGIYANLNTIDSVFNVSSKDSCKTSF